MSVVLGWFVARWRSVVDPRIRCTHLDPFFEIVHHRFWQRTFLLWWHRQVLVRAADCLDDKTLIDLPHNQSGPRLTATQDAVAAVEQQLATEFFRCCRVALVAVLDQNRTNFPFEELHAPGVCLGRDHVRPKRKRKEEANLRHDESAHVQESSGIMSA